MSQEEIILLCKQRRMEQDWINFLKQDQFYQKDCFDLAELELRLKQLSLTPEQKKITEDYLCCRQKTLDQIAELSYMAGIKDGLRILNYLGFSTAGVFGSACSV